MRGTLAYNFLAGSCLHLYTYIGLTIAELSCCGITPLLREHFKRRMAGTPSGPAAESNFSSLTAFSIFWTVMVMFVIFGWSVLPAKDSCKVWTTLSRWREVNTLSYCSRSSWLVFWGLLLLPICCSPVNCVITFEIFCYKCFTEVALVSIQFLTLDWWELFSFPHQIMGICKLSVDGGTLPHGNFLSLGMLGSTRLKLEQMVYSVLIYGFIVIGDPECYLSGGLCVVWGLFI